MGPAGNVGFSGVKVKKAPYIEPSLGYVLDLSWLIWGPLIANMNSEFAKKYLCKT